MLKKVCTCAVQPAVTIPPCDVIKPPRAAFDASSISSRFLSRDLVAAGAGDPLTVPSTAQVSSSSHRVSVCTAVKTHTF